ncbi:hypothetical protein E2320_002654 [Naja naja]|nr:hypothetical protein E2320_002654 [Naja naja]
MALEQGLHQVLEYFLGILPASRQITALARTASGLDRGLQKACAYRGLPPRLNAWYRHHRVKC